MATIRPHPEPKAPRVTPFRLRLPPAILLGITALLSQPVAAQTQDGQIWFQINTAVPVAERTRVTLEQIARVSERQDGLYQSEFGVLVSRKLVPGLELGVGYRKVGAHNGSSGTNEDRLRQQLVGSFGPFATRFRIDERFSTQGGGIGIRIRPLVRYNYKLGPPGLALFASHESFYLPNATRWGQRSGYERMRNIVGAMLPIGSEASLDIGYLNQYRPGRGGKPGQMDHALTTQLTINLHDLSFPSLHD